MAILRAANTLWLNILLFLVILLLVILVPMADNKICRRLGINLQHGMGTNPHMDRLLSVRRRILYSVFGLYLLANCYLVFFSRASGLDYAVHIAPLNDISRSVQFDSGFGTFIGNLIAGDFHAASAQLHIVKPEDIAQALTNTMFYIPMGYLLPYVFEWFRKNLRRPMLFCFACSAATENMQLIFKRGCYDFDDLFFNTLGGVVGVLLFRSFAYYITHPEWKKELQYTKNFNKRAADTALFRMARQMDCGRVTIAATEEEAIYSFFVETLGFRLKGQHVSMDSDESTLLLELGGLSVEFLCSNRKAELPPTTITLTAVRLDKVRKRLVDKGIAVSDYLPDPYTTHRSMYITGPDNIKIVFSEY